MDEELFESLKNSVLEAGNIRALLRVARMTNEFEKAVENYEIRAAKRIYVELQEALKEVEHLI